MIVAKQRSHLRRIPPEKRKNISNACDRCKKSKLKCTGGDVCSLCSKKGIKCEYTGLDGRSYRVSKHDVGDRCSKRATVKQSNPRITETLTEKQQSESDTPIVCSNDERNREDNNFNLDQHLSVSSSNDNGAWITSDSHSKADMLNPFNCKNNTVQPVTTKRQEENNYTESDIHKISYQEGKCSFLIPDAIGTLRYIGETSMYSLLYETRTLFIRTLGPTGFTNILKRCPVEDSPLSAKDSPLGLPAREVVDIYIKYFVDNINDTFFVIDIDDFRKEVIEKVFAGVYIDKANMVLMYLIFAVGSTFIEDPKKVNDSITDVMYFNKGNNALRENIVNDGVWVSQAYLLNHFFYQHNCKSLTSWVNLGIAIKYAQAFGIHRAFINEQFSNQEESDFKKRLFRTLYICDKISSVFLGRPLSITDYDCDDYCVSFVGSFNDKCQHEISRLCEIISRIIANFYNNSSIDVAKTESLAVELKLWSIKLPDELKIDKIMEWNTHPDLTLTAGSKYNLLVMHILQLFAIMLLSRPFFIYELSSNCNLMDKQFSNRNMSCQLYNASVKAAILTIKLIYYYMKSGTYRLELHVIVNCCGYAVLILGLRLLAKTVEGPNEEDVKRALEISVFILKIYSPHSPLADRLYEIVNLMLEALTETNIDAFLSPLNFPDGQMFPQNFTPDFFTDVDFLTDTDNNLETLKEFQKYFVSNSFPPTNVMPHTSKDDPLNALYANETYSLFLGEKC